MAAMLKWSVAALVLSQAVVSLGYAELPDIATVELSRL